jgi:hypothetical protein
MRKTHERNDIACLSYLQRHRPADAAEGDEVMACWPCWIIVLIGVVAVIKVAYELIKEVLSK